MGVDNVMPRKLNVFDRQAPCEEDVRICELIEMIRIIAQTNQFGQFPFSFSLAKSMS